MNAEAVTLGETTVGGAASRLFFIRARNSAARGKPGKWSGDVSITVRAEVTSVVPGVTKAADSGASLSLAAQGTNRMVAVALPVASMRSTSTSVLDELYRQLGTFLSASLAAGTNLGVTSEDTTDELANVWDLESLFLVRTPENSGPIDQP